MEEWEAVEVIEFVDFVVAGRWWTVGLLPVPGMHEAFLLVI